ncbi:MAG: flagellar hook-basal body complex protein FliE [Anaerolineae bacterium]|nr:flagellar hook-basal body complex protein FliE [Anaerolineae bacterium]
MPIDPIIGVNSITQPNNPTLPGSQPVSMIDNFGQILSNAINSLNQKEVTADQAIASLAAGEDVELHQVMLAMQEADVAFRFALQVRNKIVDAYQEIMRMQV